MQNSIKSIQKLGLVFIFLLMMAPLAQAQVGIEVGAGLIYGTEVEQVGLNARGGFRFGNWRVAPGINFFFPQNDDFFGGDLKTTVWSINIDGNYVFEPGGIVGVYPLVGLNFTTVRVKSSSDNGGLFDETTVSDTEVGVNIGAGVEFDVKVIKPFLEFKYVIGNFDQAVFTGGVKFGIGK